MSRAIQFLRDNREKVNQIAYIFLIVYFCLISCPYIFARIPALNSIFTNSLTANVLRLLHIAHFAVIGAVVMIANKRDTKIWLIACCAILFVVFVIVNLFAPDQVVSYSLYFTAKVQVKATVIDFYSKIIHIARFAGDLTVFYFLFSAFPAAIHERKKVTNVVLPAFAIATIGVVYTLIFERSQISYVLNGGSAEVLKSIFHSKNAYGIFLFNGSVVCVFAFFADPRRWTKFLVLLLPVFWIMSFLINCKLAFVCIFVLGLASYTFMIVRFFKQRIWVSITLLSIVVLLAGGLLLFFSVPQLHESGFAKSLYDVITNSVSNLDIGSFLGRTSEWSIVPQMVRGIYVITGFSSPVGYQVILAHTSVNGAIATNLYDLHNAYIDFYAYHGILGAVFYLVILALVVISIVKVLGANRRIGVLLAIILFVSLLFGMAETYTLFVSMSANTFALSFILLCTPSTIEQTKGEGGCALEQA